MITEARDDARQLQVSHIEDSRHCAALPLRPGWKVRRVARQGRRSGRSRVRTRSWRRRRSVQRRRQRRDARGEVRRPWLRAQRDGARTGRAGRERHWGAGHIRWQLTRDGSGRNTRRETRAVRVRRRRHDIRRPNNLRRTGSARTGRSTDGNRAADHPVAARSRAPACTSTAWPATTAGPGCSGVPSSASGPGAGAPFGNRVPFGSGNRHAGRPALRQNSSGSMPRFLNAASTNGCSSHGGSRLTSSTLK